MAFEIELGEPNDDLVTATVRWARDDSYRYSINIQNISDIHSWYKNLFKDGSKYYRSICVSSEIIGYIGLEDWNTQFGSADIVIVIGEPNYRSKGIGTVVLPMFIETVCTEFNISKLVATTRSENTPALSLFLSAGFKRLTPLNKNVIKLQWVKST